MDTTHYSTPNDRDGDYSYAYDSSLSPAFIIKYDDGGEGSSEDEGKGHHKKAQQENIYEEIAESHRSEQSSLKEAKSSFLLMFLYIRIGECHRSFETPPRIRDFA